MVILTWTPPSSVRSRSEVNAQFEFRAEAFNLLNHPALGTPNTDYNSGPLFGTINYTASTARELQLALKFLSEQSKRGRGA